MSSKRPGFISKLNIIFWGAVIALLLAELGAKVYIENFANSDDFFRMASSSQLNKKKLVPSSLGHNYIGYVGNPDFEKGQAKHNSLGFRGDEIEIEKASNEFRIVCIGGSTTYNTGVRNDKKTYPYRLQEILQNQSEKKITVVNAGTAGYTTWESLINYQLRIQELKPDLIIIYHAINDVNSRLVWPPEAYKADNSGYRVREFPEKDLGSFLSHFNLGRMILARFTNYQVNNTELKYNGYAKTSLLPEMRTQLRNGTYPTGIFKEVGLDSLFKLNSPVYFENNLKRIINLAHADSTEVLLSTFKIIPIYINGMNHTAPYQKGINDENEAIRNIAQKEGVHMIDIANEFPSDEYLFKDGVHRTEEGCELFAQMMADYIINNHLIK